MSFGVQSISRHSFSMVSVVTGFPSLNFCRVLCDRMFSFLIRYVVIPASFIFSNAPW
nr:MAG TPA: hypothetical protein [Caudoviricetes sp.]